jgi:Protein of unknown function (DUF2637)
MTEPTSDKSGDLEAQVPERKKRFSVLRRVAAFRPGPLQASAIVSGIVVLKSFEMSYTALHDLALRNLVSPDLAANIPLAIDGLMLGSIIATTAFRRRSLAWWYAAGLFILSTIISVVGNIEYAREIGGSEVPIALYAGMPLAMMFAVHLTLMLRKQAQETGGDTRDDGIDNSSTKVLADAENHSQSTEVLPITQGAPRQVLAPDPRFILAGVQQTGLEQSPKNSDSPLAYITSRNL